MGFTTEKVTNAERLQFENRLKKCNLPSRNLPKYTTWFLTSYLIIRTFDDHYQIHTNGDIDHYKVLERKYSTVNYECSDYKFLIMLLMESTKAASKKILETNGK